MFLCLPFFHEAVGIPQAGTHPFTVSSGSRPTVFLSFDVHDSFGIWEANPSAFYSFFLIFIV
jgi:hypothetical protein